MSHVFDPRKAGVGLWHWLLYGTALGGLAGVVGGSLEALGVLLYGTNIPWFLPALLQGSWLLLGAGIGALAGISAFRPAARHGHQDTRARIGWTICVCWAAVFTAIFVDGARDVTLAQTALHVSHPALAAGAVVLVAGLLPPIQRRLRTRLRTTGVWPIIWLICVSSGWRPFHSWYHAGALSIKGLLACAVYLILAALTFLALRAVGERRWACRATAETGRCVRCASLVSVLTIIACGILWRHLDNRAVVGRGHALTAAPGTGTSPSRPNLIWIVMDTVRADHLSLYGYPRRTTPHLDALAQESVCYGHAISTSSWTVPSHASMFTGLMPSQHGARRHTEAADAEAGYFQPLSDDHLTLAEILSANGYQTGAIIGNTAALTRDFGFDQGFEHFDDRDRATVMTAQPNLLSPAVWWCGLYQRIVNGERRARRDAAEVNHAVLEYLDRMHQGPFFLFVNYIDAHAPYRRHTAFNAQLGLDASAAARMDAYDSDLAYLDAQLGELFEVLKARDLLRTSLLIVVSDHGEGFGEHGMTDHGSTPYEEQVHVPLLIRYPAAEPHGRRAETFSLVAMMPTVLDYLGIERPQARPLPAGEGGMAVMAEVWPDRDRNSRSRGGWVTRAVYAPDGLKLISEPTIGAGLEAYDLTNDAHERRDISSQRASEIAQARPWLKQWHRQAEAVSSEERPSSAISDGTLAKLRSLGYIK